VNVPGSQLGQLKRKILERPKGGEDLFMGINHEDGKTDSYPPRAAFPAQK